MTTIAVDPRTGEIAADSRAIGGGADMTVVKLVKLVDGSIFAAAGVARQGAAMVEWLNKGGRGKPPKFAETEAVILQPDGNLWLINGKWPPIPMDQTAPQAIGSGSQAALSAMLSFGATPAQAVKAAAKVDSNTGGKIVKMRLRRRQPKRKIIEP